MVGPQLLKGGISRLGEPVVTRGAPGGRRGAALLRRGAGSDMCE